MSKKTVIARTLALLLSFTLCLSLAFTISTYANKSDYSTATSNAKKTYSATEFMEQIMGLTLSEPERAYLELYSDFSFKYNSQIPTSLVTTELLNGVLTVRANVYSYTAENGETVVWTPSSVLLRGVSYPIDSSSGYTLVLEGVEETEDNTVKVNYVSDFWVDKDSINELINLAYNDALVLKVCDDYQKAYIEYEGAYKLYTDYLSDMKIFEEDSAFHSEYLDACIEFENKMDEYLVYSEAKQRFLEYAEYLRLLEESAPKIAAYEKYIADMEIVAAQLSVINDTKTEITDLKRSLYSAITGSTVTEVLENEDLITSNAVGVSKETVDRAGDATRALRTLMKDYFSLNTDSERYIYYIAHYKDFRDNFCELLRTLDKLYLNRKVEAFIRSEGKDEKYLILLAQLYYVVNALSDEPVLNYDGNAYFDSSYKVASAYKYAKTPREILGDVIYMTDTNNAAPLENGYPTKVDEVIIEPVDPCEDPGFMEEPTEPDFVPEPIEPDFVAEPEKPDDCPYDIELPFVMNEAETALFDAYVDGIITEREPLKSDMVVSAEISVRKNLTAQYTVTVNYYTAVGGELLYSTVTDKGGYAEYDGVLPTLPENDDYYYVFTSWIDVDGATVDLTAVENDIDVYPSFTEVEKQYEESWIVEDKVYKKQPTSPTKPDEGNLYYVFSHWVDKKTPAELTITHTAVFESHFMVPYSTSGGASVTVKDGFYTVDTTLSPDREVNISKILTRAAEGNGFALYTTSGNMSFGYSETRALLDAGVEYVSLVSVRRQSGYYYELNLSDANGEPVELSSGGTVTVPYKSNEPGAPAVYHIVDGEKSYLKSEHSEGELKFKAVGGVKYYAAREYSLHLVENTLLKVEIDTVIATSGQIVKVSYEEAPGIRITGVFYTDSNGQKVDIIDGEFSMPTSDVTVTLLAERIIYTVRFVVEGKVLSTYQCYYGEIITPPEEPIKSSNGKYSFEFREWSSEIVPVTEDAVYVAVFTATELPPEPEKDGPKISESVMRIIKKIVVICCTGVLLLVSGITTLVILMRRRKKKKLKSNEPKG